jgi:hypothetical protein
MLLIYAGEREADADRQSELERYVQLNRDLRAEGRLLAGEELQPVSTATTVQVRDGDTLIADGPFAETKEVLVGFYLIEADSLDDAIDWAARVPAAHDGTIEVRPVVSRPENGA